MDRQHFAGQPGGATPAPGVFLPDHDRPAVEKASFHNESTFTSALLDRLLHHAETVVIEKPNDRMHDQSGS